ncbi:MAG: zinc-ribbon domain-containing protein [Negativicutes bacterium]
MFCNQCGQSLGSGENFCGRCGARVAGTVGKEVV